MDMHNERSGAKWFKTGADCVKTSENRLELEASQPPRVGQTSQFQSTGAPGTPTGSPRY